MRTLSIETYLPNQGIRLLREHGFVIFSIPSNKTSEIQQEIHRMKNSPRGHIRQHGIPRALGERVFSESPEVYSFPESYALVKQFTTINLSLISNYINPDLIAPYLHEDDMMRCFALRPVKFAVNQYKALQAETHEFLRRCNQLQCTESPDQFIVMNEHFDLGWLNVLIIEGSALNGLQIQDRAGIYRDVSCEDEGLLAILIPGAHTEYMTDGLIKAPWHRVVGQNGENRPMRQSLVASIDCAYEDPNRRRYLFEMFENRAAQRLQYC